MLARGKIFSSAGEQLESAGEAREERSRREDFDASGGEFNGERQAVETSANLRDGGGVLVGQFEAGFGSHGALYKQGDTGIRRARPGMKRFDVGQR